MEDILLAVGRVSKVEEITKGKNTPLLRTTLKLVDQVVDGTRNMDQLLKEFLVSGQLEFGKKYEIVIRLGAQTDIEFPSRMIREEEDSTIPVSAPPFKRPGKKSSMCPNCEKFGDHYSWCARYESDYDDEDIDI